MEPCSFNWSIPYGHISSQALKLHNTLRELCYSAKTNKGNSEKTMYGALTASKNGRFRFNYECGEFSSDKI